MPIAWWELLWFVPSEIWGVEMKQYTEGLWLFMIPTQTVNRTDLLLNFNS
jgi:hypothetical protein